MQVKATFAGLLAVFLLSISCVASACEVSCDLESFGLTRQASHRIEPHSDVVHSPMAGMRHCAMGKSHLPTKADSASIGALDYCHSHGCEDQLVALSDESTASTHLASSEYTAFLIISVLQPALGSQFHISETPPLRTPSCLSVYTILRV